MQLTQIEMEDQISFVSFRFIVFPLIREGRRMLPLFPPKGLQCLLGPNPVHTMGIGHLPAQTNNHCVYICCYLLSEYKFKECTTRIVVISHITKPCVCRQLGTFISSVYRGMVPFMLHLWLVWVRCSTHAHFPIHAPFMLLGVKHHNVVCQQPKHGEKGRIMHIERENTSKADVHCNMGYNQMLHM